MRKQLTDRVTGNYNDYQATLLLYDRQELIDRASQIADTANVFAYLTEQRHTEQELSYLLQFQNPLEVMVDGLQSYEQDYSVLDGLLGDMADRQAELTLYPLATDAPAPKPETMRKFLNVDIESTLKQLMEQMTVNYKTDLQYALADMRSGADSDRPEKKNFVVYFRKNGVECLNERDVFIGDTRSFNTCQFYNTMNRSEPILAYAVEITSNDRGNLRGNLFQVGHLQLAEFAARAASPATNLTIMFAEGHEALISYEDSRTKSKADVEYQYGGHIKDTRFEPEDESVVQSAIRQEHDRRDKLPKGHFAVHVKKLEDTRIQTEADRITEAFQGLTEPNDPDKGSFTVPISPDFIALSEQRHLYALFDKLQMQMPDKPIYIDSSQRDAGKFSIGYCVDRAAEREQTPAQTAERPSKQAKTPKHTPRRTERRTEEKPSIRAQLAVKPQTSERSAGHQHNKDKGVR